MEADGFLGAVYFDQLFQIREFPLGVGDALSYVGPIGRRWVVVAHFVSIGVKAVAYGLASHVVARSAAIVKGVRAQVNQIDAHGLAVHFLDRAAGGRGSALVRSLV